ncbi:MAG: nucleotidyltransferase domain-containing protein [Actinomycetia bacterium]|nr:nucleotidyltransferase domain-containing protein [Actinomycetes bacterium]
MRQNTGVLSEERRSEFREIGEAVRAWASTSDEIVGALLAGSWARGAARMDSDVDVVVVVTETECFVHSESWIAEAVGKAAELVRTGDWGALIERRVRLRSGLEIEFGFVKPSWAHTDPVDPGTHRVVTDGYEIWYDPEGHLTGLVATLG